MYIVAQRVRNGSSETGTNVFRYEHTSVDVDWNRPDVFDFVVTEGPGRLVAQDVEIAPGGNSVLAYVDVVAREPIAVGSLTLLIDEIVRQAEVSTRDRISKEGLWAEYAVTLGTSDAPGELRALGRALTGILVLERAVNLPPPLQILVDHDEERWTFKLAQDSDDRLRHDAVNPVTGCVRVPFDVANDFRRMHGALYPHVAAGVTGLERERLRELGGVEFLYRGRRVWELPAAD